MITGMKGQICDELVVATQPQARLVVQSFYRNKGVNPPQIAIVMIVVPN